MSFIDNAIHNMLMIILFQLPVVIDYPKNQRFFAKFSCGKLYSVHTTVKCTLLHIDSEELSQDFNLFQRIMYQ